MEKKRGGVMETTGNITEKKRNPARDLAGFLESLAALRQAKGPLATV